MKIDPFFCEMYPNWKKQEEKTMNLEQKMGLIVAIIGLVGIVSMLMGVG